MRILQIVLSLLIAMTVFSGVASAAGRAATESLFVFGNLVVTRARIVDSIGQRHEIIFTFTRAPGGNAWHWEASTTDPIVATPDPLADGTLVFTDGRPFTIPGLPEGALNLSFNSLAEPRLVWVEMDAVVSLRPHSILRIR